MTGKITRLRNGQMVAGVCAGLGNYLAIDPVFIRLAFVLFTLAGGAGLLIYLILWIIMPLDTTTMAQVHCNSGSLDGRQQRTTLLVGLSLILAGIWTLIGHIPGLAWLNLGNLWPLLVIVAGIAIIIRNLQSGEA